MTGSPFLGGNFRAFNEVTDKDFALPPDSALAVGPFQVLAVVNTQIKVFQKNGAQLSSATEATFFSGVGQPASDAISDPRAFYDTDLNRFWIVTMSEHDSTATDPVNRSTLLVALSNSNDASDLVNGWSRFAMDITVEPNGNPPDTSPKWCDYPMLGVAPDFIFISCNMFEFPQASNDFEVAKVRILSKAQFVNNQCCSWTFFQGFPEGNLSSAAMTVQPAHEYGATAADGEWMVDAESCPTCGATLTVWHLTHDSSGWSLNNRGIDVGNFPDPNQAQQPGGPNNIDTGDTRALFAFWKDGHLSTGQTIQCGNANACAAYTEVDVSGGLSSMGLRNDFAIGGGSDGNDRYYPAVDVNAAGDKTMVYSLSGPTTFISTDSISIPHDLTCVTAMCFNPPESIVAAGSAEYQQFGCSPQNPSICTTVNRWGDYSSAAADPDGTGIWVHSEFAGQPSSAVKGSASWSMIVGLTQEAIDETPPVTTANVNPTPTGGWTNGNPVFVTLIATDTQSGVRSVTYSVSGADNIPTTTVNSPTVNTSTTVPTLVTVITLQTEGVSTVLFSATDNAGNVENGHFLTVRIDQTPPVVSCTPPDSVWHATDQTSSCSATDALSGLDINSFPFFPLVTSVPDGTETASAFTNARSVCDVAGNCTTAGPIGPFMIDKKAPDIGIGSPSGSITYTLNQAVSVSYGCTDGGSGVASCTGSVPNGGNLDTSTVGLHSFTVNAVDNVGNKSTLTVAYFVSYAVCLQYDPTKALPAAAYPFRIELCDANNVDVSSSSVTVTALAILPGVNPPPVSTSGSNQFVFDPTIGSSGGYVYVLKSTKLNPGSYKLHISVTNDPNAHDLPFLIK
jgi:hypothetical protein